MAENKEKSLIICMTVQMGAWNPSSITEESIVKHCESCGIDIYLSKAGQEMRETQKCELVCMNCAFKLKEECSKTGEAVNFDIVPGGLDELKNHLDKEE